MRDFFFLKARKQAGGAEFALATNQNNVMSLYFNFGAFSDCTAAFRTTLGGRTTCCCPHTTEEYQQCVTPELQAMLI